MNIYQKLLEVRKAVPYLKKDNQGHQFKFVSSSQTLGTVRGKMDEVGLILVPSVVAKEVRDHKTKNGNHEYFTVLDVLFTWVNAENPEEKIECMWTGQGLDSGEKGVGKALTYAEKYFILKFFNIATDKDDPDNFQKKHGGPQSPPPEAIKFLAAIKKEIEGYADQSLDQWTPFRDTGKIEDARKRLQRFPAMVKELNACTQNTERAIMEGGNDSNK